MDKPADYTPPPIKGYTPLSPETVDFINEVKAAENTIADLVARIEAKAQLDSSFDAGRWVALARTQLETGFMFAVKALARPTGGLGQKR